MTQYNIWGEDFSGGGGGPDTDTDTDPNATTSTPGYIQLAGDLGGTATAPIIESLQGVVISGTPATNYVLTATSTTAAHWAVLPSGPSAATSSSLGTIQLAGALSGTATAPVVVSVQSVGITSSAPATGQVLTATSGTTAVWQTLPAATTGATGMVQLAGDLGGTATSPSVLKLNGTAVTGTPTTGWALVATSSSAATWQAITGSTPPATTSALGTIELNGDLGGTATSPSVVALHGVGVSGTPTAGYALVATSSSAATWQAITGSTPPATTGALGTIQLAGDLSGTATSPTIAKIQGIAISGTPANGYVLVATSSTAASWQLLSGPPSATSTSLGMIELTNDLGGTATAPVVERINGVSISNSPTTSGEILTTTSSTSAAWSVPSGSSLNRAISTSAIVTSDGSGNTVVVNRYGATILTIATTPANNVDAINYAIGWVQQTLGGGTVRLLAGAWQVDPSHSAIILGGPNTLRTYSGGSMGSGLSSGVMFEGEGCLVNNFPQFGSVSGTAVYTITGTVLIPTAPGEIIVTGVTSGGGTSAQQYNAHGGRIAYMGFDAQRAVGAYNAFTIPSTRNFNVVDVGACGFDKSTVPTFQIIGGGGGANTECAGSIWRGIRGQYNWELIRVDGQGSTDGQISQVVSDHHQLCINIGPTSGGGGYILSDMHLTTDIGAGNPGSTFGPTGHIIFHAGGDTSQLTDLYFDTCANGIPLQLGPGNEYQLTNIKFKMDKTGTFASAISASSSIPRLIVNDISFDCQGNGNNTVTSCIHYGGVAQALTGSIQGIVAIGINSSAWIGHITDSTGAAVPEQNIPPAFTSLPSSVTLPTSSVLVHSTAGFQPSGNALLPIASGLSAQQLTYTSVDPTHLLGVTGGTGTIPAGSMVTTAGCKISGLTYG